MTLEEKMFVDKLIARSVIEIVAEIKKRIEITDNYSAIWETQEVARSKAVARITTALESKGLYEWDSRQLDASYYHMRYLVGFHNFTYRVINEKRGMFRGYFCWN